MIESDWEGPWVVADHAFEVTKNGVANGDRLFAGISEYDDYLSYIEKKKNYEPGDTLRLIAPFLISFGVDDQFLVRIARKNANFVKGAFEAIKVLKKLNYPLKIISTSYCQYVHYTTSLAGILKVNTRCTNFPINGYSEEISEEDKNFVKQKAKDVRNLPKIGISSSTKRNDLSLTALKAIEKLDNFFWEELPTTTFKRLLDSLKPLGGNRKFNAVNEMIKGEDYELYETIVIGDSITDWVMLNEIKNSGGLAISFNGNDYAIKNANLAILSDNCMTIPLIADLFKRSGIERVQELAKNWSNENIKRYVQAGYIEHLVYESFIKFLKNSGSELPEIIWIDKDNLEGTIEKSKVVRKAVRGIAVGSLG